MIEDPHSLERSFMCAIGELNGILRKIPDTAPTGHSPPSRGVLGQPLVFSILGMSLHAIHTHLKRIR
jgi:hypothetical protein